MRWRKNSNPAVDEENPYWMSFSDIMSALLVIFILATVILILQLMERKRAFNEQVDTLQKAEKVRRDLLEEARTELLKQGITVQVSENHTVLRIPNDLLGFESKEYDIHPQYAANAKQIGDVLYKVISQDDRVKYLDTVFVEGHTDNRPFIGMLGKGNWGLSTFRAISLWQYWSKEMPADRQLTTFRNGDGLPLFSVSGYGETRPVTAQQNSEDDYRINRRIDIRFTIRRPDSRQYQAVGDALGVDG